MYKLRKALFSILLMCSMTIGIFTESSAVAAFGTQANTTAAAGVICGDVNADNAVDALDMALLKAYLLRISSLPNAEAADTNSDGSVNALDFAVLKKYLLGIIKVLPEADNEKKILIPHKSWTCGMAEGIPTPESGVLVFEADMKLDKVYNLGKTQYGQRQVYVIQSGTISSTKLTGSVMSGGLDFQLDLSNGAMEIEQLLVIKTSQGNYIYLRSAGTAANQNDVRMVPDFEAPSSSSYSWLNSGKYAGRRVVDPVAKTMKISVYDISNVTVKPDSTNSITVDEPTDVKDQPWDYRTAVSERKGSVLITENVSLGGSISVGASKRGNRNIIPITGGTVTGNINGKILGAGADYQNLGSPATIDARYLWETNDGEVIIVRNAGPFGSLVPTFEVREGSKYSYLNNKLYLSSDPGSGSGGVSITFYESIKQ